MIMSPFFIWDDDIKVVNGAARAAIYNFKTGKVFSVNQEGRDFIELINEGRSINEVGDSYQHFLHELNTLNLGRFSISPQKELSIADETAPIAPLKFLWLELTETCNLQCVHCYADAGPQHCGPGRETYELPHTQEIRLADDFAIEKNALKNMTEADWVKVIHEAADLGCRELQFIGGEPFLYRPLLRLIKEAKRVGFSFIEIFTNGTLLTERIVRILSEQNVHIGVALQGSDSKTQDHITLQSGSFEKAYKGLQLLRKFNIPTRLTTTVMAENQDHIAAIAKLAEDFEFDDFRYDVVRPVGRGSNEALVPMNSEVVRSKWLLEPDFITSEDTYTRNKWWHSCWSGKIAVRSQGQVIPCVFSRDQIVGNVLNDPLADILSGASLQQLWGLTKDQIEVCQDCEYRYACGDCRPLALGETDNLYAKYPRCTYDPYEGHWHSIDGNHLNDTITKSDPMIKLVTKKGVDSPVDYEIRFKCAPD